MRYAQITPFEVCNGKGAGVSLFVQGCHFHCKGCFNPEAWSFDGGKEWTKEVESKLFELVSKSYIKRVSILGGEPLANENVADVYDLMIKIKDKFPEKSIWLYTGFNFGDIVNCQLRDMHTTYRRKAISMCDVVIDGRFVEELKDLTLEFRGSSNQRVIDVLKSINNNEVVLYN